MESEPLELHRRGASLSTIETAPGSYSVGRMPGRDLQRLSDHAGGGLQRLSDHANNGKPEMLSRDRRRNSISMLMGVQDPQALRAAIRNPSLLSGVQGGQDSQALRAAIKSPPALNGWQDQQALRAAIKSPGKPIHIQAVAAGAEQTAALSRLSSESQRKPKNLPGKT